jgi:hypothetical protein
MHVFCVPYLSEIARRKNILRKNSVNFQMIEEYNEKNRSSVLPYRILVVQSFPYKFTPDTALLREGRRLCFQR